MALPVVVHEQCARRDNLPCPAWSSVVCVQSFENCPESTRDDRCTGCTHHVEEFLPRVFQRGLGRERTEYDHDDPCHKRKLHSAVFRVDPCVLDCALPALLPGPVSIFGSDLLVLIPKLLKCTLQPLHSDTRDLRDLARSEEGMNRLPKPIDGLKGEQRASQYLAIRVARLDAGQFPVVEINCV